MPDKNNRVLLYSNTGLFKVNTANLMENSQNTQVICANFIHWRRSQPKKLSEHFLDNNFSSDILSGKLTKFAGHFRNLVSFGLF